MLSTQRFLIGAVRCQRSSKRLFQTSASRFGDYDVSKWATVDPFTMSEAKPGQAQNLVQGEWKNAGGASRTIVDPMNGEPFLSIPDTKGTHLDEFCDSLKACPTYGLHNPFHNVHRYVDMGQVCFRLANALHEPEVEDYFVKLIQRVTPKSRAQALGEIVTSRKWLQSFSGDQVRNLARSFGLPGDHIGQQTCGYRYPFGPTCVITPFNFSLEIPLLQTFSSIFMGNKALLKVDEKVAIVMEQILRLSHVCGLPKTDVDFLYSTGPDLNKLLLDAEPRMTLFTGSQAVADKLAVDLKGKIKLEDAGFDWKILGPDVPDSQQERDYVMWQCDHDAYGFSGQKCSAQSMVLIHENWVKAGAIEKIAALAEKRNLADMTIGPVLSWSNDKIKAHIDNCLSIEGAELAFGGKPLTGHSIPACYGAYEPTAIKVDAKTLESDKNMEVFTTELFGPFQVFVTYNDSQTDDMLNLIERIDARLTAAVVSNDVQFINRVLGATTNGTTYAGIRARTT
eukprot:Awhi_evm1s2310